MTICTQKKSSLTEKYNLLCRFFKNARKKMCTHRKIQTLIRPPRPPNTLSRAHRPRPLPHSLFSAPRPSLCDSAWGLLPSSSSAAAPPLLPLPLHRPGGRGPSPSPPTPDPSPSSPFTRAAHPDPSPLPDPGSGPLSPGSGRWRPVAAGSGLWWWRAAGFVVLVWWWCVGVLAAAWWPCTEGQGERRWGPRCCPR